MSMKSLANSVVPQGTIPDAVTPATWVRDPNWLPLPDVTGLQKFAGLIRIDNNNVNYLALTAAGDYTVDWGDGTVENIASGVQANHQYNYSTYDTGGTTLVTHDGETYKQAIVTVVPNGGNLTTIDIDKRHTALASATMGSLWLDIAVEGVNLTAIYVTFNGNITHRFLEKAKIGNNTASTLGSFSTRATKLTYIDLHVSASCSTLLNQFVSCISLQTANITGNTSAVTTTASMFSGCSSLISAPMFDTQNVTNMSSMFNNCYALREVPLYNTVKVTNFSSMFVNCYELRTIPPFNTSAATDMSSMFNGCSNLATIPYMKTSAVTNFASMFSSCTKLERIPDLDFSAVTSSNLNSVFLNCNALKESPFLNIPNATSLASLFNSCYALKKVKPIVTSASLTSVNGMFTSCYSLETAPLFNTQNVTDFTGMFTGCYTLKEIPQFITAAGTTFTNMFSNCRRLKTIPLLNTAAATNMSGMFTNCSALEEVPALNTSNATNMSSMFSSCRSLESVPVFDTAKVTTFASMFSGCYTLKTVQLNITSLCTLINSAFLNCYSLAKLSGTINTSNVTTATAAFQNCYALTEIPQFNLASVSSAANNTNFVAASANLTKARTDGLKYSLDVSSMKLDKAALEDVFTGLGIGSAATVTITNSVGADTAVSKTSCGTVAGSTVVTQSNTASLSVGMIVTGTGTPLTTAIAVTFQDAGDTVTLTAHGLSNGDVVAFPSITTTTGLTVNQTYYVVGATTNTFQVSDTAGGAAKTLTTDGTGTLKYRAKIASINPNVSVTLDRPCTSTGTNTLSFRNLDTSQALLKGWTVTG